MRSFCTILALTAALLSFASCEGEKMLTVNNQQTAIDNYVQGPMKDNTAVYYESGVRVVVQEGDRQSVAEPGDQVTAGIEGHIFNNGPGTVFSSDTLNFTVGGGMFVKGLDDGIAGTSKGEVSYIIMTTKYGFYDDIVGIVPAMSPLLYKVEIFDIAK